MITIRCSGVCCGKEIEVPVPEGWYGAGEVSDGVYCDECVVEMGFFDAACAGCVSGFPDCGLGKSFMYSRWLILESDLETIRKGRCPCRVNGTMLFNNGVLERLDISEQAPSASGIAVANAIVKYHEKYRKYYK